MLMNTKVSRRLRWERWKNRHAVVWDFVTTPLILIFMMIYWLWKLAVPLWVHLRLRR
jgi:hypothetical protein